jgi:hypothetical protein
MLKIVNTLLTDEYQDGLRERPFNLKGRVGGGGYVFIFLNILIPNVAEKM